jgi:hypothetical protein
LAKITLLALVICFVFGFATLRWRRTVGDKDWITALVLALVLSLFLAHFSVSSVWIPHGLSDDVFHQQSELGEYAGTFPLSRLSYPFSLSVYHTPFKNLTSQYPYMYGEVQFSTLFACTGVLHTKGTFGYFYPVMGPMPLQYDINFPFSEPLQFFSYLLVFFTIFNYVGALLGLSLAYAIEKRRERSGSTPNRRRIPKVGEDSERAMINLRKMVVLIPVVFVGLYFYLGTIIWGALLSSFSPYAGGGLENMLLFVFISWIGFGFLVCYFLGLLMITILRNKRSEKIDVRTSHSRSTLSELTESLT